MPESGEDPALSARARHRRPDGQRAARRRGGAHRAAGLAGPTRRYLFAVALLAGTASMPVAAALSAGRTVGGAGLSGSSTPFIAPPPGSPIVVVPLPPTSLPQDEQPVGEVGDPLIPTAWRRLTATGDTRPRVAGRPHRPPHRPSHPTPSPRPTHRPDPTPSPSGPPLPSLPPRPTGRPDPRPTPPSPTSSLPPLPTPRPTMSASPTPASPSAPERAGASDA